MNTKTRFVLMFTLALLGGAALWTTLTWAAPDAVPLAGGAPTVVAYQGEVQVGGSPYTGNGFFKFAVVDASGTTTSWSNDGSSTGGGEPTTGVPLAVSEGLFSVLLGDTTLAGMTQALAADVFNQPDRYLRVWFSASVSGPFEQLLPDTRIAAVPFALQAQAAVDADTVDGFHASELGTHYQNVVVVAQSGGDFTGVQAAIDSIGDAAADNPYLVWVAPGVYSETVTMKPYVHLQGAGQEATVITSMVSSSEIPPTTATLLLASDTSLRDLTVGNGSTGDSNAALLATAGVTRNLVADVTVRAQGSGAYNFAIVLSGSGTSVMLQGITALAENGRGSNHALYNDDGAVVTLCGGSFTGRGGGFAYGIYNSATLTAENVTALGESGSTRSHGLGNSGGSTRLHGSSFTGRGGTLAYGIYNLGRAILTAENVTALGENGSDNSGLHNRNGATAILRGGKFTGGQGGTYAYGLYNTGDGTTLTVESVTALGEGGNDNNYGLYNADGAAATLSGGSFTGRGGGGNSYGIHTTGGNTFLEAEGVAALGENGSSYNYGLEGDGAVVTLRGGSFTGRGGGSAIGIQNINTGTLEAEGVTALGENGNYNYGLANHITSTATLHGGFFTGRGGGGSSYGLYNYGDALVAEGISALGENGGSNNYGLYNYSSGLATITQSVLEGTTNAIKRVSGSVTVSNTRLVGGAVSGTATCVLVTWNTTISTDGSTCP